MSVAFLNNNFDAHFNGVYYVLNRAAAFCSRIHYIVSLRWTMQDSKLRRSNAQDAIDSCKRIVSIVGNNKYKKKRLNRMRTAYHSHSLWYARCNASIMHWTHKKHRTTYTAIRIYNIYMKISVLFRFRGQFDCFTYGGLSVRVLALSYSLKSFYKTIRSLFFLFYATFPFSLGSCDAYLE